MTKPGFRAPRACKGSPSSRFSATAADLRVAGASLMMLVGAPPRNTAPDEGIQR